MQAIPCSASRRLFIVGDPTLSRGLLKGVLSKLGYAVSTAVSGTEALRTLVQHRFALVIIAAQLPDMSGVALVRQIRSRADEQTVPLIMLGDERDRQSLQRSEAVALVQGFVQKPIALGRLVGMVQELTQLPNARRTRESLLMSDTLMDLAHLGSFTDGDRGLENELTTLFVATAGMYVDRMRGALGDPVVWKDAAHSLKGASANIGARSLSALAGRAEQNAPSPELIDQIARALEDVRGFLHQRRNARA